jgi:16S rRNA (cytidine1402-2'-O)-methyltransferase
MPLIVCATPIGNLEDVTLRVLRELAEAELVLCEDTRRTGILLERHGIQAALRSLDRHHEARRAAEVLPRLERGSRIALVSDAGLPGVNDPGARLIGRALEAGVAVTVLPGPSAVETALVASGLLGGAYAFLGYVPRTETGRARLWHELARFPGPAVLFESPKRLPRTLRELANGDPERPVAVCRELTKLFEEVARGPASLLADQFRDPPKGEVTLVVGQASDAGGDESLELGAQAVAELVAAGAGRRRAAQVVARLTGVPANTLYDSGL